MTSRDGLGAKVAHGPFTHFPPGADNVWVPLASRQATLGGLSLYAACRPRVLVAQRITWALVKALGPSFLPARRVGWEPPMSAERWDELCDVLRGAVGRFDDVAVYQPRQASRSGLGLLLMTRERPVAFVKARPSDSKLDIERRALEALAGSRRESFSAPVPLGHGRTGGWEWVAVSPLPTRFHRPARRPALEAIAGDVQAALRPALDPAGGEPGWQPMHGDLTPWNLRRLDGGALWLLDWEDVAWAPPGADETYYRATAAAMAGERVGTSRHQEAVRFWQEKIKDRPTSGPQRLNVTILEVLQSMAG